MRQTVLLLALVACGDSEGPREVASTPSAPHRLGLGTPATAEEIAAWDIDVEPSGAGLPPGRGTVAEGRTLYAQKCAACHGPNGEGGLGPLLVASEPKFGFAEDYKLPRTIGNYWPYATTIYDYVHRAMPQTAPGSLSPDEVYALVAFLLAANGAVPADFVADAETLPAVRMPTQVEFIDDDRESVTTFR